MMASSSKRPQARCLICLRFGVVGGSIHNQSYRYRHCHRLLQSLEGISDTDDKDENNKSEDVERTSREEVPVTPNHLFVKFLQFASRYLSLKGITAPILEASKECTNNEGGGDIKVFCEGCRDLVSDVCDLYAELEFVRLHLVWKLSQLGGKLTVASKKNVSQKLGKGLLKSVAEKLHIKEVRALETFRKALELKCIRKWKDCAPKPVIPSGLFPEHWKHPYSATKVMLMRLIVVFLLASSTMFERPMLDPDPATNDLAELDRKHVGRRRRCRKRTASKRFGDAVLSSNRVKEDDLPKTDVKEEKETSEEDTTDMCFANFGNEDNGADSDWSQGAVSSNTMGADVKQGQDGETSANRRVRRKRKVKTGLIGVEGDHNLEDQDEMELSTTKPSRPKKRRRGANAKVTKAIRKVTKCPEESKVVMFGCNTCEKKFFGRRVLLKHLESVHETPEKHLQCWFCPRKFTLLQTLDLHRVDKDKHNGRNMFPCEELPCSEKFWNLEKYEEHLKTHLTATKTNAPQLTLENESSDQAETPGNQNHLGEEGEGEATGNEEKPQPQILVSKHPANSINDSDNGHKETTQMILHCSKCNWCFLDPDLLKLHEIIHDENPNKNFYQCPKCPTFYRTIRSLLGHFHDIHRKIADPFYECSECGKKILSKQTWLYHMKLHKIRKEYEPNEITCSQCGFIAKEPARLEMHMKRHDPNSVFPCSEAGCRHTFVSSVTLERHIAKVHGKMAKKIGCPFKCGYQITNITIMMAHIRTVHGPHKFICDICGNQYKAEHVLDDHKKREHGDPNAQTTYICSDCGMSYRTKWGLRYHIGSVHTPESEKRYGCPHCPKRCHRMVLLRRHIKTCVKINGVGSADSSLGAGAGESVSSVTSATSNLHQSSATAPSQGESE